jgi:ABC-2 type transport system permease protein
MLHLLQIEWLKLRKYKAFWILLVLGLGFSFGWNYFLAYQIGENKRIAMAKNPVAQMLPNPYELPGTYQMVTYTNSYFMLALGILMILLLTNEYNYRTTRQNIIEGLSRTQFAISKLLVMVIIAAFATLVTFLTVIFVGTKYSLLTYALWDNLYYIGYFFIQSLVYLLVALLIAMLVKRSGLAIGLYFFLMLADTIIGGILNRYLSPVGYFMPVDVTDWLIQNPIRKISQDANRPGESLLMGVSIGYIVLFIYLFIAYFKKADLK